MASTYQIGSLPLDDKDGRWRLTAQSQVPTLTLPERDIIQVPGTATAWTGQETQPPATLALQLWISNRPRTQWASWDRLDEHLGILNRALAAATTIIWAPDGRTAHARHSQIRNIRTSEVTLTADRDGGLVTLDVQHGPYWWTAPDISHTPNLAANASYTERFTQWKDATGPLADLRLTFPATVSSVMLETAGEQRAEITNKNRAKFTVDLGKHFVYDSAGRPVHYEGRLPRITRGADGLPTPLTIKPTGSASTFSIGISGKVWWR